MNTSRRVYMTRPVMTRERGFEGVFITRDGCGRPGGDRHHSLPSYQPTQPAGVPPLPPRFHSDKRPSAKLPTSGRWAGGDARNTPSETLLSDCVDWWWMARGERVIIWSHGLMAH